MRKSGKETVLRWIDGLNKIKQELNDNNCTVISELIKDNSNSQWHGFLIHNNIIYKNEFGFYKWNDKIPITYKLIEKFRDFVKSIDSHTNLKVKQQPTLFDKTKTRKVSKRGNSRRTTIKWINSIKNIQEHLSKNNETCLSKLIRHFEIDQVWVTFLLKKVIVYKNDYGYYKWNAAVEIDSKLIEKFRSFQKEMRIKDEQQSTLFDKSKNDIEATVYPAKIKQEKHVVKRQRKQVIEQPKQQIGLIRKFWKWIY